MEIGNMQIFHRGPPQMTDGLKSRSGEGDNYFDNQCYL